MNKNVWGAAATLSGTVVGAGVLGLPYVVAKAGIIVGIIDIIGIGLLLLMLNLFFGEITLRTKGNHHMGGYAKKYLGEKAKNVLGFATTLYIYGAMIAYLLGIGLALQNLFGGSAFIYGILFFILATGVVLRGIKSLGKNEFWLMLVLSGIVIIISFILIPEVSSLKLSGGDWNFFAPFGVVLFASNGIFAIPLMKEELFKNKKDVKKAILIGSMVPPLLYVLFSIAVVGAVGTETFMNFSPDQRMASTAIHLVVGGTAGILANVFAIIAMATSFFSLAISLNEMFIYDFGIRKKFSLIPALGVPLLIYIINYLTNLTDFIQIIGISGLIAITLIGIMMIRMYYNAKIMGDKMPEFILKPHTVISLTIVAVLLIGFFLQMFSYF